MINLSCHCGAVRLQVASAPTEVTDCNCSICRRLGVLWAYFSPGEVTFLSSPGATAGYIRAGGGHLAFHHCRVCGSPTHWRSLDPNRDRMGVNARLMDPDVIVAAKVRRLDGAVTETYFDG